MIKLKKIPDIIIYLVLGTALGVMSKYLDTITVDGSWWTITLDYFADLFTRLGIWILIATIIAAYSKTLKRAAINTFIFFIGMLISYYIYSAYLFGFFPTRYFILWGSFALVSPLLAIIVWKAKNNILLAFILPALPMGLLLSLSLGMGLFYVYLKYIEELIMYVSLCVVFYKSPKQITISIVFSIIVAIFVSQISPFHF
ncbi:hypothetical protein PB01_02790 [Psychrobacillus glaciei]|uniref:Uncharacterized protein n=1 Tax=Psychrobacillus glaciei TaxID=2283160 RepID=A0A5J6SIQ1_9BACI|nr:hypothetical protein [Psychrobacillus glaciei]QFF97825.1 hypothetical protein PB01_02790 [Psychrobacillus glaciei]